ncbi:DUF6624 domain-containing protein [Brevundimonas sp.]|uniref:DUF6624 domain-containing protein n=1 Tax=Brevundimonas sp. TaxID=1871086 RepID=UPI001D86462B|nr:DUF6624 domain-containing protein [Brevundimonas sp.]MBA3999508.1 hypothetical protein [Brevundimonas sp.]
MIGSVLALVLFAGFDSTPPRPLLDLLEDAEAAATFDYPSLGDAERLSELDAALQQEVDRRRAGSRCVTPAEQAVLTGLATASAAQSHEAWRADREAAEHHLERWRALIETVLAGEAAQADDLANAQRWIEAARDAPTPRLAELFRRSAWDQAWRGGYLDGPDGWAGDVVPGVMQRINRTIAAEGCRQDMENAVWLKTELDAHGWFRISQHGEEADRAAWLIVQHADQDPQFQTAVLAMLEPLVALGETRPSSYAYLHDRVAVNTGRPQRYGTQGRCTAPNVWTPRMIEDEARVEALREQVDIGSLTEYRAHMSRFCAHYDG